jgi:hypothetical protein
MTDSHNSRLVCILVHLDDTDTLEGSVDRDLIQVLRRLDTYTSRVTYDSKWTTQPKLSLVTHVFTNPSKNRVCGISVYKKANPSQYITIRNPRNMVYDIQSIVSKTNVGDTIVVYFSGHGMMHHTGMNKFEYITTGGKSYRDSTLKGMFIDSLPTGVRMLLLPDVCFSGSMFNLKYNLDVDVFASSRVMNIRDCNVLSIAPVWEGGLTQEGYLGRSYIGILNETIISTNLISDILDDFTCHPRVVGKINARFQQLNIPQRCAVQYQ